MLRFPLLILAVSFVTFAADPILNVGSSKQLFIDRRFVQDAAGVQLVMNPPAKAGVVLRGDRPWDTGWVSGAGTVIEDNGRYRMWYTALPPVTRFEDDRFRLCYAESKDGVHWEKPNLGISEWRGSRDNNILMETNIENAGGVFVDPTAPPAARYKLVAILNRTASPPDGNGLYVYQSADGLRWTLHPKRVFPFIPDTVNMAFYDARLKKYVAYLRVWDALRKVGRVETDDILAPWPFDRNAKPSREWKSDTPPPSREIPTAFGYDERDPSPSDHYTSAVVQYPWAADAYFMFPSAYLHYPPPPKTPHGNDGPLDIQLAVSRDGVRFERVERAPYIRLGPAGTGDGGSLYMFIGMLRQDNNIYQYYGGVEHTHGAFQGYSRIEGIGAIYRVIQRLDGLSSVDAAMEGGSFRTPVVRFAGKRLALNVDGSAMGEVRVELQDDAGRPIPGFDFDACDPIHRNHLERTVSWNGKSDISQLASRPVRIAFRLRAAKLYAFQFLS